MENLRNIDCRGQHSVCVILLIVQGRPPFTPGKTMGHVWDGDLEEYNNPMPEVELAVRHHRGSPSPTSPLYPGLGTFKGFWTSGSQGRSRERLTPPSSRSSTSYMQMDVKAVVADKKAMETGKRLYMTHCPVPRRRCLREPRASLTWTDGDLYGGEP